MILNDLIRTLIGYLSAWYPNKEISLKKDLHIRNEIIRRIKKLKLIKKNLKNSCEFNHKRTFA